MATRVHVVVDQQQLARVRLVYGSLRQPKLAKPVSAFLLKAAYAVLTDAAQNQIIRGGRFRIGKTLQDTPAHPSKLTSRTGELRRSLGVGRGLDRGGLPRYVDVGSDLVYARIHEVEGAGKRRTKRPFLAPAVEAVSPRFEGMLLAELEKAVDQAERS